MKLQHFAHTQCNASLAPAEGDEDRVSPLAVYIHSEEGVRALTSYWRPNEVELANLLAGGCVALTVLGKHPPVRLEVQP